MGPTGRAEPRVGANGVGRHWATEYLVLRDGDSQPSARLIKQPGGPEAREEVRLLLACLPAAQKSEAAAPLTRPTPIAKARHLHLGLIAVVRAHRLSACSTDSCHRLRLHRHLLPVPAAREGKELRPGPGFRLLSRVESSPDLYWVFNKEEETP